MEEEVRSVVRSLQSCAVEFAIAATVKQAFLTPSAGLVLALDLASVGQWVRSLEIFHLATFFGPFNCPPDPHTLQKPRQFRAYRQQIAVTTQSFRLLWLQTRP